MFKQSCTILSQLPKQNVRQWVNSFETIITDADGVLWHFQNAIDGAVETLNLLRSTGRRIFVVTNNSGVLSTKLVKKANDFGIILAEHEMITSAMSVAKFLQAKKFKKKAYVIGEQGLADEIAKVDICTVFQKKDPLETTMLKFAEDMQIDEEVGAVVVGKDDSFSVAKIMRACAYLTDPKILFLGTCYDAAYPIGNRRVLVGAAAMLAAVRSISGRKPLILGKPNPLMVAELTKCGVVKPQTTLMIGDTLQSDIVFGYNSGFQTLMVGSGVTSLKDVQKIRDSEDKKKLRMVPDTYLPNLCALQEFLC